MSNLITILQKFSDKLNSEEISVDKKYRTLKAIRELGVTLDVLKESRIGRAVKKCSKLPGKPGLLANKIVQEWTEMIQENEKKNKHDVVKPSKSVKYTENKPVQQGRSSSGSESEYSNRNKTSKHNDYKKSKDNHASDIQNSSDSLSENENQINHNRKEFENHNSDSDENINKKFQQHNKILESSKMNQIKLNRDNTDDSDLSSVDIDSDECDEFAENLKSSKKSDGKHEDKINSKVRYDDENFEEYNHSAVQKKTDSSSKYTHKQMKQESDDSDIDSDEAHFQRLDESRKKSSKMDNIDFLMPSNENINKNNKKKLDKVRNDMKSDLLLKNDKPSFQDDVKKPIKNDQINIDNKKFQVDKLSELKPPSNVKIFSNSDQQHKHKSRKTDIKQNVTPFEIFLKDSALSKPVENQGKKRKSENLHNIESKKPHLQLKKSPTHFAPTELSDLPALNSSLSNSDMDEQSVYNRTDLILQKKENNINYEMKEDIDCTTKYSSERKIWTPKSNIVKHDTVEENIRTINGVLETEIAQYNYEKLKAFDGESKKIQRKTEFFWEKLFKKNHKSANKRDGETWREAYIRNQNAQDYRLKEISERLKKNTEESLNAIPKAKLLTNSNLAKPRRRMTDMRR